jgi:hypothetical protein
VEKGGDKNCSSQYKSAQKDLQQKERKKVFLVLWVGEKYQF